MDCPLFDEYSNSAIDFHMLIQPIDLCCTLSYTRIANDTLAVLGRRIVTK
jgi:hypothetical protein